MRNISQTYEETMKLVTFDNGFLYECDTTKPNRTEGEEEDCRKKVLNNPMPEERMYPRYGASPVVFVCLKC